jgi:anti-sigma factor RsiW
MMKPQPITEDDLQAYVDGRTAMERMAELEAWLIANPAEAARIARYREHREGLANAWNSVLTEPVPQSMLGALSPASRFLRWAVAASIISVFVGTGIGWGVRGAIEGKPASVAAAKPTFYRQAAMAHAVYAPEVRHPVEVGADQQDHLVKWLSKRLGAPLNVPNLGAQGYKLMGGRLLPASTGAGAQFMFEDSRGQRLTLYVSNDKSGSSDTAFRFAQENKVSVFYWVDGPFGYALSGEVERERLLSLANVVYKQLNP